MLVSQISIDYTLAIAEHVTELSEKVPALFENDLGEITSSVTGIPLIDKFSADLLTFLSRVSSVSLVGITGSVS